jgi:peptidoglycan/xylan/chitin deacetylase (PgdA/CDA1 family)
MDESNSSMKYSSKSCSDRKKRVSRMKTAIIIIVIILLILPTVCCILLGLQVSRLQRQVDNLYSLHGQYGVSSMDKDGEGLAYAAVMEGEGTKDSDAGLLPAPAREDSTEGGSEVSPSEQPQAEEPARTNPNEKKEDPVQEQDASLTERAEETNEANPKEDIKEHTGVPDKRTSEEKGKYAGKKVYLTFDDGPSIYTGDILDILEEYKVKATFFVVGKTDKASKKLYQRIVEEGHTLGMHSYSHQYSKIYNSIEDFDKDFTKLWKLLYDTTGYKPSIFRFPGGSNNLENRNGTEDFIRYLNKAGIVYFDWNVLNGDATGVKYTEEQLIDNVLSGVAVKDNAIVLMHDTETKQTTVDSLPGLLDILVSEDAQILPLDKEVKPIQMIKADTVK